MNKSGATVNPPVGSSTGTSFKLAELVADIARFFTKKNTEKKDFRKKIGEKQVLAKQLHAEKQYEEAVRIYSEAIYWCPQTAEFCTLYLNRSACFIMMQQYSNALEDVEKCLELDPYSILAWRRLVKCYLLLGYLRKLELAIGSFERMKLPKEALIPELTQFCTLKMCMLQSKQAYKQKNYQKVFDCMERCREISPACVRFKDLQAECLAYLEKYTVAETLADDVLNTSENNANALFVKAYCLYYQDKSNEAFALFQEVLQLDPNHEKALETYDRAKLLHLKKAEANAAFGAENYEIALSLYDEALLIDPKCYKINAKLYFNKALIAFKMNKIKDAIKEFCEAIKFDEDYLKAIFMRAKCFMKLEEYDLAIREMERALELNHTDEIESLLNDARQKQQGILEKKNEKKDYYKILGIEKTDSTEDVIKAYKNKAMEHHPDRHRNETEEEKKVQEKKFKEVVDALACILSGPINLEN